MTSRFVKHSDRIIAAAVGELKRQDLSSASAQRIEDWLSGLLTALEAIGAEL